MQDEARLKAHRLDPELNLGGCQQMHHLNRMFVFSIVGRENHWLGRRY